MKGGGLIKVIVHYPGTPENQAELEGRIAKFHAEYVAQYIEKLSCPTEQKLELVDAIIKTILDNKDENNKK